MSDVRPSARARAVARAHPPVLRQTKANSIKRLAHTAPLLAPCHPPAAPFSSFHRLRLFVPLPRQVKKQTAGRRQKGKNNEIVALSAHRVRTTGKPSLIWCDPVNIFESLVWFL